LLDEGFDLNVRQINTAPKISTRHHCFIMELGFMLTYIYMEGIY